MSGTEDRAEASSPNPVADDEFEAMMLSQRRPRPPPLEKHQWFDAWKTAKTSGLKTIVEDTLANVAHYEERTKARKRARRGIDEEHHRRRVEAIVCNLAHAVLLPPPTGRIAVKLGKGGAHRTRYDSPVMSKTLSPLIWILKDRDLLDLKWVRGRGEVSSIAPTAWFSRRVCEQGVELGDFGRHETEEVIFLARNTRPAASRVRGGDRTPHREHIDYEDTPTTRRYRETLRRLNTFLADSEIVFDGSPDTRVDPFDRTLRRRFTILEDQEERFDQNGRLFGGFWQTLSKASRRAIRINGEEVVELDYRSMFSRLAYADVGATPPEGDLYAIPELAGYRSGVKMAMNTLLFDSGLRRSWQKEIGVGVGTDADAASDPTSSAAQFEARLPAGYGVKRTKEAILKAHPCLKDAWGRRLGYTLMFRESEILIAVLEDLAAIGTPALGIHDGLIVPASRATAARGIMERRAIEMTGVPIPVGMTGDAY